MEVQKNIAGRLFTVITLMAAPVTTLLADSLPCVIEPTEKVELGSPVVGVLAEIRVERGDQVKKGQVVARLAAQVERKSVDLAMLKVNDYSEIQAATAALEHAKREKTRAVILFKKSLVSKQALDKAVTEETLARHRLEQARENQKQSEQALKLARAKLNQRILRSPIDGIITERYLSPGDRIQDQPIVRIAKVDPLRVEVIAPAKFFNQFKKGQSVEVTPKLPGFKTRRAKVIIIDRTIDAASNTFRVTLELANPDLKIPAGARCTVDMEPAGNG